MSTVTVQTCMPERPVAQIPLGTVNSFTQTVFRNGQCLSLAVALEHLLPGSRMVAILVDDDDWFDEDWAERIHLSEAKGLDWLSWGPYVVHLLVQTAGGDWVDSNGEHDPEGFMEAVRDVQGPAAAVYLTVEQAQMLAQTFPPQHWTAGEAFAKTLIRSGFEV